MTLERTLERSVGFMMMMVIMVLSSLLFRGSSTSVKIHEELGVLATTLDARLAQMEQRFFEIDSEMMIRGQFLQEMSEFMEYYTDPAVKRQEIEKFLEEIKTRNPSLDIPPIPTIVEAMRKPPQIEFKRKINE